MPPGRLKRAGRAWRVMWSYSTARACSIRVSTRASRSPGVATSATSLNSSRSLMAQSESCAQFESAAQFESWLPFRSLIAQSESCAQFESAAQFESCVHSSWQSIQPSGLPVALQRVPRYKSRTVVILDFVVAGSVLLGIFLQSVLLPKAAFTLRARFPLLLALGRLALIVPPHAGGAVPVCKARGAGAAWWHAEAVRLCCRSALSTLGGRHDSRSEELVRVDQASATEGHERPRARKFASRVSRLEAVLGGWLLRVRLFRRSTFHTKK